MYLDVVHAWNCAINRNVAPDAGTLYESRDDIQLSRFQRSITDAVGWFSAGPMPTNHFSDPIRRFLSWDPIDADWNLIRKIAQKTVYSALNLQAALMTRDRELWTKSLHHHAVEIAECLVNVPVKEIPEWYWTVLQAAVTLTDIFPSEYVDIAKEIVHDAPYLKAAAERKQVVNTLSDVGPELLAP